MDDRDLISNLGGVTRLSQICGLTPAAVSQWNAKGIPRAWRMFFLAVFPKAFGLDAPPDFSAGPPPEAGV